MATNKLADLVIVSVRYEHLGSLQRIAVVRVSNDLSRQFVPGEFISKFNIVEAILHSRTVVTARWTGFQWEGDPVSVFRTENNTFIRTDGSSTPSDNLGCLPRM